MPRTLSGQRSSFLVCRNWLAIVLVTVTLSVLVPAVRRALQIEPERLPCASPQGDAVQDDLRHAPHLAQVERGRARRFRPAEIERHAVLRVTGEVVAERVAPVAERDGGRVFVHVLDLELLVSDPERARSPAGPSFVDGYAVLGMR